MSDAIVTIRIFLDGTIRSEVRGISGPACSNYIPILEDMLGAQAVDSEPTAEYYLTSRLEDLNRVQEAVTRARQVE